MAYLTRLVARFYCDFCGKHEDEVKSIVTGPRRIAICDECIRCCVEIIERPSTDDGPRSTDHPKAGA